jgi:ubiquinone/menaquinone biosynthesis C-methylase UbiE
MSMTPSIQKKELDAGSLRTRQYGNDSNLVQRLNLHSRFSTNPEPWHRWVFDRIYLVPDARVLEIGCGTGALWLENRDRLPKDIFLTLSDFSKGMLDGTRRKLQTILPEAVFAVIDVQDIPLPGSHFDIVPANQVLYHVPDRERALLELRRVLRPEGRAILTTIGRHHVKELHDLLGHLVPDVPRNDHAERFGLESGAEQVWKVFGNVERLTRSDSLEVTDASAIEAYVASLSVADALGTSGLRRLHGIVTQEIEHKGSFHITKEAGILTARRSR